MAESASESSPRKRALLASLRSVRTLLIVFTSAAIGIFLLAQLGKWQANSHRVETAAYTVDSDFVRVATKTARPTDATENAVLQAAASVSRRGKAAEFGSRDPLLAELMTQASNASCFPTRATVLANARAALTTVENKIVEQRKRVAEAETAPTAFEKPPAEIATAAKRASADLDQSLQRRAFLVDDLNLKLGSLADEQRAFYASATDFIDRVVEARRSEIEAQVKAGDSTFEIGIEAAKAKHPLHVVYEATWYFSLIIVVLAIGFCVGSLLRILPYPGSDEKWTAKMEELAERPKAETTSPVASWLITAAALGVGAVAATHAMREVPGSPLYGASYMDAIPFTRIESPAQPTSASSASYTINTPPLPNLYPTFALNQPINFSPAFSPEVKHEISTSITGLDQLKDAITGFKEEAAKTNDALLNTKTLVDTEIQKTQAFENLVTDAKSSWDNVANRVAEQGQLVRNALVTADFNDDQRQLARLDYDTVGRTHRVWRTFLALARYRVNDATMGVFNAEPACDDKAAHEALRYSLDSMKSANVPPAYKAPFTTTLVNNMVVASNIRPSAADAELRRHVALILESSRTAE